ncbi:MAG: 2-oxoacid:acceptor oxidoreductase subunit alpha [Gammaproteobacteria bacterium]|nr:2-oxoacid:acceptor oxidoreductase subunit alpha [Gammaproteobacteria bacterium]
MKTLSIAVVGSGGAGALTTGNLLLEAAARLGCYGIQTRSVGPQIRGGEAAAMVRLSDEPIDCISDRFDIMLAMDWNNVHRFAPEILLDENSLIIGDPAEGEVPPALTRSNPQRREVAIGALAKQVRKGRANMIALGVIAEVIGLPDAAVIAVLEKQLGKKGEEALLSSLDAITAGRAAAAGIEPRRLPVNGSAGTAKWIITGNHAAGLGAIRGGIKFVAAYPITPATEVLEWISKALSRTGGTLVQAEDELASINMILGASFGGQPSLTATSGPGLSLMVESLGLAVSAEVPIVVIDVMRGGPSTGIPTIAEQSDLNIAVYGLHGDAPHLVLAPNSVTDCVATTQWSVFLAEALQTPAVVLSDQYLGQARCIIDAPQTLPLRGERLLATDAGGERYQRYAVTESGVSPMAIPGLPGCQHTADGLEHNPIGTPSSTAADHQTQLDKRQRKLTQFDFGDRWADIEGDGELAIITWGSVTGAVREALGRLRAEGGGGIRLVSIRLLTPVQPERFAGALAGVKRVLLIEQSHSAQFRHFLAAHYRLPEDIEILNRAGPLLFRAGEVYDRIKSWSGV